MVFWHLLCPLKNSDDELLHDMQTARNLLALRSSRQATRWSPSVPVLIRQGDNKRIKACPGQVCMFRLSKMLLQRGAWPRHQSTVFTLSAGAVTRSQTPHHCSRKHFLPLLKAVGELLKMITSHEVTVRWLLAVKVSHLSVYSEGG